MVYQKKNITDTMSMEDHCRDPSMFEQPGVMEAAIWLPTLVTRYKSASEILATDNFFQDYKYFYGEPQCQDLQVIDERVHPYFFHEDGNLNLNGTRFNYTQYCVATIGKFTAIFSKYSFQFIRDKIHSKKNYNN